MAQTVSSAFQAAETANAASFYIGAQVAWQETLNSAYSFFTIGTSTIGGPDFIPGTQAFPTMMDQYQYTDETDYILGYTVTRSLGQYPYGVITASATLTLDNTTLRYTPGHDPTIGQYVNLPGRPVKMSFGFVGTESIALFAGYTTGPMEVISNRTVTQNIYDAMNYLNSYNSVAPVQVNQRADQIIITILSEMGLTPDQYEVEQSTQIPIGYYAPYGLNFGQWILYYMMEAEQGICFFDENGVFHFWNRDHIANISTPSWSFDYNSIVDVQTEMTPVINSVQFTGTPRVVQANQLVWELTSAVQVPANGTYTLQATFSDPYGDMPVPSLDTPVYAPNGLTDSYFTTNLNSDGSGIDPGTVTCTSVTNSGSSASIVFSNSDAQPVWITGLFLFGTPAKVTYELNILYNDSASIKLNGINPANNGYPLEIMTSLVQTPDTALSDGYMLVNDYSTPNVRVVATTFEVPQLQIGDMVTITFNDTALSLPGAPTVTPTGTAGTTSYFYKIVALNSFGNSGAGAEGSTTTGNATLSATNYNALSWMAVTAATGYDIWRGTATGAENELVASNVQTTTYNDVGSGTSETMPTTNTSANTDNYTLVGITESLDTQSGFSMQLELERKILMHYFQINVSTIAGPDVIGPG